DYITLAGLDYDKDEDSRIAVVAKKIKGTIYEEPSQETDGTTDNGKNSTVHKTVEKSDDTKDLKDRAKEDIRSKLAEEYPTQTIYRINDDRYIISDNGKGAEKTMIYDASSDSVIFTLNGNESVIDVFEDKFGTYKFVSAGNNEYAILDVTIFDDSGNILYKYEIDTKAAGILNGVENDSKMHVSPDGKTLVYRNIEYIKDDSSLDIVDHFICFKYEDQKNPVNIADYRGCFYAYDFAVSNDMLIVDHSTEEYNRSTDLYSLDTDSKDNTAALDVFGTAAGHFPKYIPKGDSILCVIERNNTLLSIKPDDNGDIKLGDKTYTITEYELAGTEDGNKTNATISDSGRYAASVYSTDDNKLVFTLYEIDDDNVTELKTIKKDLADPEFEVLLSADLNEQTGEFSVRRIIKSNEIVTADRIDSVNFFE
uniref:hypothetical protein n=1 Tax=uncultured Ruminococcus sp. TaxID=165186 RepID=UPI0025DB817C